MGGLRLISHFLQQRQQQCLRTEACPGGKTCPRPCPRPRSRWLVAYSPPLTPPLLPSSSPAATTQEENLCKGKCGAAGGWG